MFSRLPPALYVCPAVGVLLVYLPWQLLRYDPWVQHGLLTLAPYSGVVLCIAGVTLVFSGAYYLGHRGGNTSIFTAPHRLVVAGPYGHIQHPILLGLLLILFGEALWLCSPTVGVYDSLLAFLLHLYILCVEEPRLENRFGADYRAYRTAIPRWFPRHF
ncbi:MAG: isoprenylcysteine carboxylmethyltransferase family protein [Candidatus Binatia bacterium]